MSTTVKAGWLKDEQGNKFAPKTLSSQVIDDSTGNSLDDVLEEALIGIVYADENNATGSSAPLNADTLGGRPAEDFVLKTQIDESISSGSYIIPIEKGGTNSANGATGLSNLFASGNTILSSYQYGDTLPAAGIKGRIFFKKVSAE